MILIFVANLNLVAQQNYKADDLEKLSVDQAERLLDNTEGEQIRIDMVSAAINSKRMDLIQMCFENIETDEQFVSAAAQIPDQDLRDQIVLMMLKSGSPFWRSDSGQFVGGVTARNYLREPFTATIKRNLGDLSLNNDLIATEAARAKLAGQLEVVIDRRSGAVPPPEAERPKKRLAPQSELLTSPGDVKPTFAEVKAHGANTSQQPALARFLVFAVIILTTFGILWFAIKKLRS